MRRRRDVNALVEEAVQDHLDAAAIKDLDDSAIAETQIVLLGELREIPDWNGDDVLIVIRASAV